MLLLFASAVNPQWQKGPWGTCTVTPFGPQQTRTVWCRDSGASGACLDESQCTQSPKPVTKQTCDVDLDCSFDNGDYCGIVNPQNRDPASSEDVSDWVLANGPSAYRLQNMYPPLGPLLDNSGSGYYIKIGDMGYANGTQAVLEFPPIMPSADGTCAMYFFLNTHGHPLDFNLRFERLSYPNSAVVSQLATLSPASEGVGNDDQWRQFNISIPAAPAAGTSEGAAAAAMDPTGAVFVRLTAAASMGTIVGLDDVTFSAGCTSATKGRDCSSACAKKTCLARGLGDVYGSSAFCTGDDPWTRCADGYIADPTSDVGCSCKQCGYGAFCCSSIETVVCVSVQCHSPRG